MSYTVLGSKAWGPRPKLESLGSSAESPMMEMMKTTMVMLMMVMTMMMTMMMMMDELTRRAGLHDECKPC